MRSPDGSSFAPPAVPPGSVIALFETGNAETALAAARVALIGTYTPRKCGIATFTFDVVEQLGRCNPEIAAEVYAIDEADSALVYQNVAGLIDCGSAESYARAARRINESAVDAVWLQHEYGIFGGVDGEMVCDFVDRLAAPLIVTFHTVLSEPSPNQRRITEHLIARASRIMVMSRHGRDLLVQSYGAPADVVDVIPHGAPDRPFGREAEFKMRFGLENRNVLMTFGLLGPGKGLEQVIEALPAIVARHPETVYRIVGATHPNLLARNGESYRQGLQTTAERLGVAEHVIWDDRFLEADELLDWLEACDIYVTPYLNLQQATSGTLSYAVALGKAVVSTPYVHARELLADGVGVLVRPNSSEAIAEAVNSLLDDREQLHVMKRRAYAAGRDTIWPRFAAASAALIRKALRPTCRDVPFTVAPGLAGVFAMSDSTGMLQHSIGIVPDRRHGYCLDDNARALMLMNRAEGLDPDERLHWCTTYASFIQHAWNPELRCFRNFMRFDRSWCEEVGSEDSNGRALWALGNTVARAPHHDLRRWALRWFDEALPSFDSVRAPRALAFAMLGARQVLDELGWHAGAEALLRQGGEFLFGLLETSRGPAWTWFEPVLSYDNPRLPQALIEAGAALRERQWTRAGLQALAWITERQTSAQGHFRPLGSESFGRNYQHLPFDQQPLEAQAAVEGAASAYAASGDERWIEHAMTAYRWFFGANDRGVVLADLATGRCRDGVTPRGVNENCGAESILAFQLSHIAVLGLLRRNQLDHQTGERLETKTPSEREALAHS